MSDVKPPSVWAVVLGYNNAGDTIECLHSVLAGDLPGLKVLYVDNGSRPEERERVLREVEGCEVLALEPNAGVAGGFNAGIRHACANGADQVVIFNNDTKIAPDAVRLLSEESIRHPAAGMIVPKIFYYAHPTHIWSAGSYYRRFPPVVVQHKTRGPDDGRHDHRLDLEFTTFCIILLTRAMLETTGLLDPDYHFLYEDYDLCLRARDLGFGIRFVPGAHAWHKISQTTGAGTRKPAFWHTYGRSESIFRRKFRHHRWLTGWTHALFIVARFVAEGNPYGVRPYIEGWRKGARDPIQPPPGLDDARVVRGTLLRKT